MTAQHRISSSARGFAVHLFPFALILLGCGEASQPADPEIQPELEILEMEITPNPTGPGGFVDTSMRYRVLFPGGKVETGAYAVTPGHEILRCEMTDETGQSGAFGSGCGMLFEIWARDLTYSDHLLIRWKVSAPAVGLYVQAEDTLWITPP